MMPSTSTLSVPYALARRHPAVLQAMADRIPEFADGAVDVVDIAVRNNRWKVAVASPVLGIDAVSACVGRKAYAHATSVSTSAAPTSISSASTTIPADMSPTPSMSPSEPSRSATGQHEPPSRSSTPTDPPMALGRGINVHLTNCLTHRRVSICTEQCTGSHHQHPVGLGSHQVSRGPGPRPRPRSTTDTPPRRRALPARTARRG